ncbi:helix-turn-helix transcriptional regulator [Paeniglutamicibacter sp. NPDC012692]|uniref:helix-turn-helix transcriptional regulator n=1 Tax=Paeniglutamicibacter sp. NPDC012692 TaxID=3364388 RepID=UPI0036AF710D
MNNAQPRLWDSAQVAEFTGLTVHAVAHLRRSGRGPAFSRLGKHVRYTPGDVRRWVDQNKTTPEGNTP